MYHIKKIVEINKEEQFLVGYSGYCIIILIANLMEPVPYPTDYNMLVDYAFTEYDYGNENHRPTNACYIDAARKYLEKIEME